MSFFNRNLVEKPSLIRPIFAIIAIFIVIGIVYFFGDKNLESEKSVALDKNQAVANVGDVENVIAKWVEANPEAIIASLQNMQQKAAENKSKDAQKNIAAKKDELFGDKTLPQYSPKGYDVTVVEFFDYACGYCKKANKTVQELIKSDKKLRVVYIEFPILGEASVQMSAIALAVNMIDPKSYAKFHDALMDSNERGQEGAMKIAKSLGLNIAKIEKIIAEKQSELTAQIQKNLALGSSIGVNGTPGFVIGEELIPGAFEIETFREKIAAARK